MTQTKLRDRPYSGFLLLELMLVMALSAVLIGLVSPLLFALFQDRQEILTRSEHILDLYFVAHTLRPEFSNLATIHYFNSTEIQFSTQSGERVTYQRHHRHLQKRSARHHVSRLSEILEIDHWDLQCQQTCEWCLSIQQTPQPLCLIAPAPK